MTTADISELSNGEAPDRPERPWWPIVGLLMLVVGSGHFNRVAISVAGAEHIIRESGISETRMGWVYSAFLFFYTLAMVPAGWLIDRVGARATLIIFCFGSAIFVAGTSAVGLFSPTATLVLVGLLLVRSLMGIVNAPLHPAAARMVYAHVPLRAKSFANGLVTFSACLGISATYFGFGLLAGRFGWPTAFFATGWFTLVVGLVWVWGTRSTGNESTLASAALPGADLSKTGLSETVSADQGVWPVLLHPGVICLTLSYAALGYFQYLFFYWIQYYIGTVEHLGDDKSRLYSTGIMLTMGFGMIFGGWLADRIPPHSSGRSRRGLVSAWGMVASGVVFELGLLGSDSRVMVSAFTISAALLGMCEGAFWTTAVELGRTRGGLAAGMMNMGGNAGGFLSPIATPLLGEYFGRYFGIAVGWRASLAVAGAISVVGALLWLGVHSGPEKFDVDETRDRS
jgi:ACS family D-galactonate transporter-like MFS transporter